MSKAYAADAIAASAAAVSAVGMFHEFAFHDVIGSLAGLMAITYYVYQFGKWLASYWDNGNGD